MLYRHRYILPVVVLMVFGGWVYSDEIPKPDLGTAIQNLQSTLTQLQSQIKDLQSSVKELAHDAKEARKEKAARAIAPAPINAKNPTTSRINASSLQDIALEPQYCKIRPVSVLTSLLSM